MTLVRSWRRPSWFALIVTGAGIAIFVSLGMWQLRRAAEAERILTDFSSASKQPLQDFARVASDDPAQKYAHVRVLGHFVADGQYLRDEQTRNGMLGVEVYAAFARTLDTTIAGAQTPAPLLLVDRGWVVWSRDPHAHSALPPLPEGNIGIDGVYAPFPGNGIRVGGNALITQKTWPKLTLAIDAQEIASDVHAPLAAGVLLLDVDAASGFVRQWTPNLMPPQRHQAYAFQWFAFALAALAICIVLHRPKSLRGA